LLYGHTAKALVEFADEHQPDLIVVGARGLHATLKVLLGGIAQQVVEYARWPVLVVRALFNGIRRLLLAVDGSPYSRLSAEYLAQFPLPGQTEVSVMHVLPPIPSLDFYSPVMRWVPGSAISVPTPAELRAVEKRGKAERREGRAILRETRQILKASGIQAKGILAQGDLANEILEHVLAEKIDLVVAGSRGLSAIKGWWWGSVSRKLVHSAACSTLFVRGRPERME
jgi:nucleotide-binding universal stress UspA family protein